MTEAETRTLRRLAASLSVGERILVHAKRRVSVIGKVNVVQHDADTVVIDLTHIFSR